MKKILSAFLAAAVGMTLLPMTVSAAETEATNMLVLGDSISTGYGLSDDEISYGELSSILLGLEYTNSAVNGYETSDLLNALETDAKIDSSVTGADVICVSIGGNDLLQRMLEMLNTYKKEGESWGDAAMRLTADTATLQTLGMQLLSSTNTACQNIVKIADKLKSLNGDAQVVFQTVYNPFEAKDPANTDMVQLNKFAEVYLKTMNDSIKGLTGVTIADTYADFGQYGWLYTNIDKQDIHPNQLGHVEIASRVMSLVSGESYGEIYGALLSAYLSPEEVRATIPQEILNGVTLVDINQPEVTTTTTTEAAETTTTTTIANNAEATKTTTISAEDNDVSPDTGNSFVPGILALIAVSATIAAATNKKRR